MSTMPTNQCTAHTHEPQRQPTRPHFGFRLTLIDPERASLTFDPPETEPHVTGAGLPLPLWLHKGWLIEGQVLLRLCRARNLVCPAVEMDPTVQDYFAYEVKPDLEGLLTPRSRALLAVLRCWPDPGRPLRGTDTALSAAAAQMAGVSLDDIDEALDVVEDPERFRLAWSEEGFTEPYSNWVDAKPEPSDEDSRPSEADPSGDPNASVGGSSFQKPSFHALVKQALLDYLTGTGDANSTPPSTDPGKPTTSESVPVGDEADQRVPDTGPRTGLEPLYVILAQILTLVKLTKVTIETSMAKVDTSLSRSHQTAELMLQALEILAKRQDDPSPGRSNGGGRILH